MAEDVVRSPFRNDAGAHKFEHDAVGHEVEHNKKDKGILGDSQAATNKIGIVYAYHQVTGMLVGRTWDVWLSSTGDWLLIYYYVNNCLGVIL